MTDIEILARESMNYGGELRALPSEPLIHRARRLRFARRACVTAALGVGAIAAFAATATWPQATQPVMIDPATSPTSAASPTTPEVVPANVTVLEASGRVTTPGGAVIVASPEKLCVGNTREEPSCLIGADPTLDSPSSSMGWYTTSPKGFVYAWLTPEGTTNATLKISDASPTQAALYKVEGREMLIAVVTGASCWTDQVNVELVSTDPTGRVIYTHSAGGTCTGSLPDPSRN
jgi:hypothetical protein